MMEPMRAIRDLQSPAYGAMSHVVGVLIREVHATATIATCQGGTAGQKVFVSQRLEESTQDNISSLRGWPNSPQSTFWKAGSQAPSDIARCLDPARPVDADWLGEVSQALCMPELNAAGRCLMMTLAGSTNCQILFISTDATQSFTDEDCQRLLRYAGNCKQIIDGAGRANDTGSAQPQATLKLVSDGTTDSDPLRSLSQTERVVLNRLCMNETERQVAEAMGRSPNTIHVHVKSIYRKLRVSKRTELLALMDQIDPAPSTTEQQPERIVA